MAPQLGLGIDFIGVYIPGIHIPGYMMAPQLGLRILVIRRPRKPRRIDPPGHDTDAPGIGLEHRRGDRIEDEHGLGVLKRLAENPVIFGRADSGEGSFMLMERPA